MAYADQQMSTNKVVAIILVALIHVAIGYALITGLAYSAVKQAIERVTTVDVKEPEPEEEPPPPPPEPDTAPPPPVAPPPPLNVSTSPPQIQTQVNIPPPAPPARIIPPAAPPAPPPAPPPPPSAPPKAAQPRGNYNSWASTDDYPAGALRAEREGVTSVRVTVSPEGRVSGCQVTKSSGHSDLDSTTCNLITRRGRFTPAEQGGRPVEGSWSTSIRWEIPDE